MRSLRTWRTEHASDIPKNSGRARATRCARAMVRTPGRRRENPWRDGPRARGPPVATAAGGRERPPRRRVADRRVRGRRDRAWRLRSRFGGWPLRPAPRSPRPAAGPDPARRGRPGPRSPRSARTPLAAVGGTCEHRPMDLAMQGLSAAGAALILAAFVRLQRGRCTPADAGYLWCNFAGAAALTAVAAWDRRVGFIALEGTWTVVSALSLVRARRAHSGRSAASARK
ncbi:MAG: hypothetical protein D6689_04630 [Deltaproteobacteria bacterium]|nr:MAG: hypothetical protein D6689_04630 [Deltaproteobacteria bacterium]